MCLWVTRVIKAEENENTGARGLEKVCFKVVIEKRAL